MTDPERAGEEERPIVLISMLEHWSYCPRQCALIHLESTFDENLYTQRGRFLHKRVDEPGREQEGGIRIERALPLWSERLGLSGKADVVEFREGVPYPVEYKSGPRRRWGHDDLQLCAQAFCLEEMTEKPVPMGAVYHHGSRRRREVVFTEKLRADVERAVEAVRTLLSDDALPPPANDARCEHCSLRESCLPGVVEKGDRLQRLAAQLFQLD